MLPLTFTLTGKLATAAFAFKSSSYPLHHHEHHRYHHISAPSASGSIYSPWHLSATNSATDIVGTEEQAQTTQQRTKLDGFKSLSSLCRSLSCFPSTTGEELDKNFNLFLSSSSERGVFFFGSGPKSNGDVLLSVPLSSCWRDDTPPGWFRGGGEMEDASTVEWNELDITDYESCHPSSWTTRLAASLLDAQLGREQGPITATEVCNGDDDGRAEAELEFRREGLEMWHSMLPDPDLLRASLPVHWTEEMVSNAKCTALEVAVDSSYFARANAVITLSEEWKKKKRSSSAEEDGLTDERLMRMCHDALDLVQTRACRVERKCEDGIQWGPPLHVLAPIFDFLNYASPLSSNCNAAYGIESVGMSDLTNARLVVRATRTIISGEEIQIDYGEATRPSWRCLEAYGFVPEYVSRSADDDDEEEGFEEVENVAELWMNGLRFEVDPFSVPFELVENAAAQALFDEVVEVERVEDVCWESSSESSDQGILSPSVAAAIAERARVAAFHMVLEPEGTEDEENRDNDMMAGGNALSPETVRSAGLAASLRWSQHKVLLDFAKNLDKFAKIQE